MLFFELLNSFSNSCAFIIQFDVSSKKICLCNIFCTDNNSNSNWNSKWNLTKINQIKLIILRRKRMKSLFLSSAIDSVFAHLNNH